MTRLWREAVSLRVTLQADAPHAFAWGGQRHTVVQISNQWRVDMHWWKGHIRRDYYRVVTDTGLAALIYHDLIADTWQLSQVYD
ncbi:MAG: hypothetical protein KME04_17815 [Pleurocapsa minor GSE-CHR-MK-17-07R]|jgi:hypothetical protein|nr:hypothetical protein [Pleurocapsa minor GSE-CHR-MK 17-07R]